MKQLHTCQIYGRWWANLLRFRITNPHFACWRCNVLPFYTLYFWSEILLFPYLSTLLFWGTNSLSLVRKALFRLGERPHLVKNKISYQSDICVIVFISLINEDLYFFFFEKSKISKLIFLMSSAFVEWSTKLLETLDM